MGWEEYAPLQFDGERRYLYAPLYAQIARSINARRAFIGHAPTEFSYIGAEPTDNALVGITLTHGEWPRTVVVTLLAEFKDSIEWCASHSVNRGGHTYYWVEPGPIPYGTTRRITVEGDVNTITDWAKIVGCIREMIAGLDQIWTMPRTLCTGFYHARREVTADQQTDSLDWQSRSGFGSMSNGVHFVRNAQNSSVWWAWRFPGYPPGHFDYVNGMWTVSKGSHIYKITNTWGNMAVPLKLRVAGSATSCTLGNLGGEVSIVWNAKLCRLSRAQYEAYKTLAIAGNIANPYAFDYDEILFEEICGSMHESTYEIMLTTPPGEDIYLAACADATIPDMGDWVFSMDLDPWPETFPGDDQGAYYLLLTRGYDENANEIVYGLRSFGSRVPGM